MRLPCRGSGARWAQNTLHGLLADRLELHSLMKAGNFPLGRARLLYGGDLNKFYIRRTRIRPFNDMRSKTRNSSALSNAIAPFWDLQAGVDTI